MAYQQDKAQYHGSSPYQTPAAAPAYYGEQPAAVPQMTIAGGGNRNAKNMPPVNDKGERAFSNGICGCFGDCGTCCVATWCPCIVYGQNKTRLKHLEKKGVPHPDGGDSCGTDCWFHCLLTSIVGCGWILQIGNRGDVRDRYRIEGSGLGDCCNSFWCNPCSLTQESREIELEETSMVPKH